MKVDVMVYYEVNFNDDNDSLCVANNHADFVIWKPQPIDLCWPVMAEWIILYYVHYRKDWFSLNAPASY